MGLLIKKEIGLLFYEVKNSEKRKMEDVCCLAFGVWWLVVGGWGLLFVVCEV
jgi:hypothetical protein